MPVVIAWVGEMLLSVVGQLAISALLSLGIGFIANKAVSGVIDSTAIRAAFNGGGADFVGYIGWMGIDQFITITLSAMAGAAIMSASRVHLTSKRAAP